MATKKNIKKDFDREILRHFSDNYKLFEKTAGAINTLNRKLTKLESGIDGLRQTVNSYSGIKDKINDLNINIVEVDAFVQGMKELPKLTNKLNREVGEIKVKASLLGVLTGSISGVVTALITLFKMKG